jgi:hypothetical protein
MGATYKVRDVLGTSYGAVVNKTTHETYRIEGALPGFEDDFRNTTIFTTTEHGPWLLKDTGAATEAIVANQSCGVVGLLLTNGNEKQEAGITHGDSLTFNLDKGVIFEARVAVHTAPTDQAELYFGVSNAYVEGPIAEADAGPTVHAFFCFDGGLVCTLHTDDASTDNNAVATGITVVEDAYHVFRIDATVVTSIKFYIDGTRVAASTTFDMSNGTNVVVQPYLNSHKEAGAGVGGLYVDYVKVWQLAR